MTSNLESSDKIFLYLTSRCIRICKHLYTYVLSVTHTSGPSLKYYFGFRFIIYKVTFAKLRYLYSSFQISIEILQISVIFILCFISWPVQFYSLYLPLVQIRIICLMCNSWMYNPTYT